MSLASTVQTSFQPPTSPLLLLAILKEIGAASDSRDKYLKKMGLDREDQRNVFDVLHEEDKHNAT